MALGILYDKIHVFYLLKRDYNRVVFQAEVQQNWESMALGVCGQSGSR